MVECSQPKHLIRIIINEILWVKLCLKLEPSSDVIFEKVKAIQIRHDMLNDSPFLNPKDKAIRYKITQKEVKVRGENRYSNDSYLDHNGKTIRKDREGKDWDWVDEDMRLHRKNGIALGKLEIEAATWPKQQDILGAHCVRLEVDSQQHNRTDRNHHSRRSLDSHKREEMCEKASLLGKIELKLKRPKRAAERFQLALDNCEPLPKHVSQYQINFELAIVHSGYHSNLAKAYIRTQQWRAARCHLGQVLTLKRHIFDKRHASIAATCYLLACVYVKEAEQVTDSTQTAKRQKFYNDALALLLQALSTQISQDGGTFPELFEFLANNHLPSSGNSTPLAAYSPLPSPAVQSRKHPLTQQALETKQNSLPTVPEQKQADTEALTTTSVAPTSLNRNLNHSYDSMSSVGSPGMSPMFGRPRNNSFANLPVQTMEGCHRSCVDTFCKIGEVFYHKYLELKLNGLDLLAKRAKTQAVKAFTESFRVWQVLKNGSSNVQAMLNHLQFPISPKSANFCIDAVYKYAFSNRK